MLVVTATIDDLGDGIFLETEPGKDRADKPRYFISNEGDKHWRIGEPGSRSGTIRVLKPGARERVGLPVKLYQIGNEKKVQKSLEA